MRTPIPLHCVLEKLKDAGHQELWITSPNGVTCFEEHPLDQSKWLLPMIITRNGRKVAHRDKKPNGWLLSENWENISCFHGADEPNNAIEIDDGWRYQLNESDR